MLRGAPVRGPPRCPRCAREARRCAAPSPTPLPRWGAHARVCAGPVWPCGARRTGSRADPWRAVRAGACRGRLQCAICLPRGQDRREGCAPRTGRRAAWDAVRVWPELGHLRPVVDRAPAPALPTSAHAACLVRVQSGARGRLTADAGDGWRDACPVRAQIGARGRLTADAGDGWRPWQIIRFRGRGCGWNPAPAVARRRHGAVVAARGSSGDGQRVTPWS